MSEHVRVPPAADLAVSRLLVLRSLALRQGCSQKAVADAFRANRVVQRACAFCLGVIIITTYNGCI
jgi:hypothetical protein